MIGAKERIGVLEMSLSTIQSQVSFMEEMMDINPPVTDLSSEGDSMDLEYADVDDGGVMMVEDSEDKRENMPPPPPPILKTTTPHPAPVLQELILIEEPAPEYPGVNVKGEDDLWHIPPVMCCQIHTLDEFTTHRVDPLLEYVDTGGRGDLTWQAHCEFVESF
jgi:hypothetical protein